MSYWKAGAWQGDWQEGQWQKRVWQERIWQEGDSQEGALQGVWREPKEEAWQEPEEGRDCDEVKISGEGKDGNAKGKGFGKGQGFGKAEDFGKAKGSYREVEYDVEGGKGIYPGVWQNKGKDAEGNDAEIGGVGGGEALPNLKKTSEARKHQKIFKIQWFVRSFPQVVNSFAYGFFQGASSLFTQKPGFPLRTPCRPNAWPDFEQIFDQDLDQGLGEGKNH